ncbi:hypothetical protein PN497_09120 [Sphaerospermopsis kisseleviana CS-549]|uniref:Transposase n=2 Tax=Sphaerospermopsis TaxID=752201 RepID=A0A479ZV41_9CYAN|nr:MULTISPECIES: hypothetical protein [Sphaerospermopsis]MBD2131097.1 hypothetical protein [Sphaerospermopsis sp. FACHB-1094]MDB9441519.1 hypothetical protein [Sphaerospermopsis kisseleviana CS-549]BAZ83709.1 transposase [Sphaerospermopsis kisseleviana NIES-73]GCL35061.1 transposase [Sphaerospermopsis reniformis]
MFAEIQQQGYKGSYDTVARYTRRIRTAQGIKPRKRHLVKSLPKVTQPKKLCLTPRRAVWLVLRKPESQQPEDKELRLMNIDTLRPKGAQILSSTSPLSLDPLRCLTQRWFSPRQLLQVGKPAQRTGS